MNLKHVLILFPSFLYCQNFPYQLDWATYLGGHNTEIPSIHEDLQSHSVITDGTSNHNNAPALSADYYNQFITPGGLPFTPQATSPFSNEFYGKLSSSGNMLLSEYPFSGKYTRFRDQAGNFYLIEKKTSSTSLPAGTWLPNPVTESDMILSKYDSNKNLLWKSYIPGGTSYSLADDEQGNIYITGTTTWQNLGDPGTFQPGFTTILNVNGVIQPNSYIVKLNPQGQKIWATYTPSKLITCIYAYEDNIYIAGGGDLDENNSALASQGTFQYAKSTQFLSKINGNTGQRIWGTYYGNPGTATGHITAVKVTSSGIYLGGSTIETNTYYATEGAYKQQSTGWLDIFLTKFDDNGNRSWSTYLGGDDLDYVSNYNFLDVKNDKILICGTSEGSQNIASPGTFVDTKPNPVRDDAFFSMFTTGGKPIFISYYGAYNNMNIGGPYYSSDIGCKFSKNTDAFYLFGTTENPNGFATSNGHQQHIIYPEATARGKVGFLAKFSSDVLSVAETNASKDLVLYNNPNNGNFSLRGSILEKESHLVNITDMSGRLIYAVSTSKNTEEHFRLAGKLGNGSYLLSVKKADKTPVKTFKLIIKK